MEDIQLYVSAVTLGEIQAGLELMREQDPGKADEIETWLDLVAVAYNVVPMDAACFRAWVRLMHRKSDTLYEDAMIPAAASVHGLTVATTQRGRLQCTGVAGIQPFCTVGHWVNPNPRGPSPLKGKPRPVYTTIRTPSAITSMQSPFRGGYGKADALG